MLKKSSLLIQVLIAIALAMVVGGLSSPDAVLFSVPYIQLFGFLGKLFLNALTLLVVPLVGSSIVNGISSMGKTSHLAGSELRPSFSTSLRRF